MPKEGSKANSKNNSKNSSKTARVLGLLTNPPAEEEQAELLPAEPEHEAPKPPQPSDDQVVEAEVRDALAHELEGMIFEMQEETSTPAVTPDSEPQPVQPAESAAPAPAAQEPAPAEAGPDGGEIAEPVGPKSRLEPEIFCFNITQALVEAKADKYIDLFGLCKCDRCRIDVIALALTNLPAKYVVARKNEMVPLLSVYEGKYNAAIVSQVMNACKMVMEHPRHNK